MRSSRRSALSTNGANKQHYAGSFQQKLHEERFGIKTPRVLFLTASEAPATAIRKAAQEMVVRPQKLMPGMFLFAGRTHDSAPQWVDVDRRIMALVPVA